MAPHKRTQLSSLLGFVVLGWLLLSVPGRAADPVPIVRLPAGWRMATEMMSGFPAQGLQLFVLDQTAATRPLRAFCLAWDPTVPGIAFKPVLFAAGRTPTQFFAAEPGRVFAAANGGFFGSGQSFSLVLDRGTVLSPNIKALTRTFQGAATTYFPTRAAFGFTAAGRVVADWIYHVGAGNSLIYAYPAPSPNRVGDAPQPVPTATFPSGGAPWTALTAIGGSPMLIKDGVVRLTDQEELIDINNTSARPRTAIGTTADGVVLLVVVEGDNSPGPAGISLAELATLVRSLGCTQAVNLDGGGSTSLVAGGRTTVRPSGGAEREVASAVLFVDPVSQQTATSAPSIHQHPWDLTITSAQGATLQADISGGALSYQWSRDGAALPGATAASLRLDGPAAQPGRYALTASNRLGSITTAPATVRVRETPPGGLANLSVRAFGGTGEDALVAGFVVRDGSKSVLVRGIGPALAGFGVTGTIGDPRLSLATTALVPLAANDNWIAADTAALAQRVGAFALPVNSRDAALTADTAAGGHLATLTPAQPTDRGGALLEIYDAGGPGALANLSARSRVANATGDLIAGFVIRGESAVTVLIRAIGPSLAAFGVTDALRTPRLTLSNRGAIFLSNTAWANAPNALEIWETSRRVGAFALPAVSNDAALLVTLDPGAYTAIVSSATAAEGIALVEVYEVR